MGVGGQIQGVEMKYTCRPLENYTSTIAVQRGWLEVITEHGVTRTRIWDRHTNEWQPVICGHTENGDDINCPDECPAKAPECP